MKIDLRSEPVQTIGVPLVVAIVGILVARGFIDSDVGDIVLALVFGVTGVTGVRAMRARVVPLPKAKNAEVAAAAEVMGAAHDVLDTVIGSQAANDITGRIAAQVKATPPTGL